MESRRARRDRTDVDMTGYERPDNAFILIFFEMALIFGCIHERRPAPVIKHAIDMRPVVCKKIIRK